MPEKSFTPAGFRAAGASKALDFEGLQRVTRAIFFRTDGMDGCTRGVFIHRGTGKSPLGASAFVGSHLVELVRNSF